MTTLAIPASNLACHPATTTHGLLHESKPCCSGQKLNLHQSRRVTQMGDDDRPCEPNTQEDIRILLTEVWAMTVALLPYGNDRAREFDKRI